MNGPPHCRTMSTDQDSVYIRWRPATGAVAHLDYYAGCDYDQNAAMAKALFAAPRVLPIAAFIGPR